MKKLTRLVIACAATLMWFSATAPDAGAVTMPVAESTSTSSSAACVAVRGVGYGYCLPTIPSR